MRHRFISTSTRRRPAVLASGLVTPAVRELRRGARGLTHVALDALTARLAWRVSAEEWDLTSGAARMRPWAYPSPKLPATCARNLRLHMSVVPSTITTR